MGDVTLHIPDIDAPETPEKALAMALFPELYAVPTAARVPASPFTLFGRIISLIYTGGSLAGAGIEPTVRELTARANIHTPNATPGPEDMVRFELREVFREKDRADQLAESPSEDFYGYMQRLGFNRFWADSYWAAHWQLPSTQQAFEMFQRLRPGRVSADIAFTGDDLAKFLKKQDVLAEYRGKLTAIAFNPLTRVDIRRMYHLGTISYDEMVQRYQDIGYNPTDAKLLADFTVSDYNPEDKDLSVAQLIQGYQEGVISDSELASAIGKLGYAQTAQSILIETQSAIKSGREAKASQQLSAKLAHLRLTTRRQSRAGKLDVEDMRLQLSDLGLSELDAQTFLDANTLPLQPPNADLSKADTLTAYKKGVMSQADAVSRLHAIGYDAEEIAILLASADAQIAAARKTTTQKSLTLAQIKTALKTGTLAYADAVARLRAQNYTQEDVDILLAEYQ